MQSVTISPKYQVVIPRAVREAMPLRPGQKLQVLEHGERIEFVPERDIRELRGLLRGADTSLDREGDRL